MNAVKLDDAGPIFDARTLRNAFGCYPTGVTAICALIEDEPVGMAVSSFVSVSLDPSLVLICIQKTSTTWEKLKHASRVGVSVLGEEQHRASAQLASKNGDRFAGIEWQSSAGGAIFIDGSAVSLDCTIGETIEAGDHVLVLLKVEELNFQPRVNPLVFHGSRYRKLATETAASE